MKTNLKWLSDKLTRGTRFRKSSPQREKTFQQMRLIWEHSAKTELPRRPATYIAWQQLEVAINTAEMGRPPEMSIAPKRTIRKPLIAFAMVVIIGIIVLSPTILEWINTRSYSTSPAEQITFSLSDHSSIRLNYNSHLAYKKDFNTSHREVYLEGEAYFDVQSGSFPFTVNTDGAVISVTGTLFNIKVRDDMHEIVVNQGTVTVTTSVDTIDSTITVHEDEYIIYEPGEFPQPPQEIPFEQYPGWIHGKLIFYQTNLLTVCKEIERKFDVTIELSDQELGQITVTGVIEATDLDTTLSILSSLVQKRIKKVKGKYIIY